MKLQIPLFFIYGLIIVGFSCDRNGNTTESHDVLAVAGTIGSEMPKASFDDLMSGIDEIPRLTSFLLYQDDEFILEHYNGTMTREQPVNIKSASKSIISALVGIAVREGYIESVYDPAANYLPAYFESIDHAGKQEITIHHLLTMSSGLRSTSFGNYGAWVTSSDWVGYALHGDLERLPGERMRYSTGDSHILSAVLTEATGMNTRRFAEEYLFGPMGIRIGGWDRDPQGYFFGGNNMAMSPAGLLALGKLYLQNGAYQGEQIIPSGWVEASLTSWYPKTSYNPRGHDYGYLWWRNDFAGYEAWFAWGFGGQYLFLVPDFNAIVIFTGDPDARTAGGNNRIYNVMEELVIPRLYHTEKDS